MKHLDELIESRNQHPLENDIELNEIEDDLIPEEELKKLLPPGCWPRKKLFQRRKINQLPEHGPYDHKIDLEEGAEQSLKHTPLYSMSPHKLQKVKQYLQENLAKGFIQPTSTNYSSPILFVEKKDGGLRFCVDYRGLNRVTKKNDYPIPLISEIMDRIAGKKYFSRFDIVAAFNNLQMHPDSAKWTAFKTPYVMFQYNVMPFGLTGGPSS